MNNHPTDTDDGSAHEDGCLSFTCTMKRRSGVVRRYRVTVDFRRENSELVAIDGFDPDAIDAEVLLDGEWITVEFPRTLARLRGVAEDIRWEPKPTPL